MEFKIPYLLAMRDQAPKMFNRLRRTGAMSAHLQAKSLEAHRMYEDLAKGQERLPGGKVVRSASTRQQIKEQVFAALIEFPPDETDPANRPPEPNLDEIGTTL